HQSAAMSPPLAKCCASPPATSAVAAVAAASGVCAYSLTWGAEGFLKSGPTAQPDSNKAAMMAFRLRIFYLKHDATPRTDMRLARASDSHARFTRALFSSVDRRSAALPAMGDG